LVAARLQKAVNDVRFSADARERLRIVVIRRIINTLSKGREVTSTRAPDRAMPICDARRG